MKSGITNVVYYFAEKFKHAGKLRGKIKALFGPCYRLVCRILWRGGYCTSTMSSCRSR